ncbi:MAG TPA: PilZ domain-containing protein [bacterium]|nr:PilZ domain-containing protein [bacterium]
MSLVRRRHPRVPVETPVYVYAGPRERTRGTARDVSLSGMRLEGGDHQGIGSRIYLEFALPHHRDFPVMAIGRVVWADRQPDGTYAATGIEVLRYFPSARFAVRSFLDRHRRRRLNYNLFDES